MTTIDAAPVAVEAHAAAIVVRPATVADLIALHRLAPSPGPRVRWPGSRVTTTLVCVRRGVVLGAVDVSAGYHRGADAFLSELYVRPGSRGQGMARLLLRGACANIVAQGLSWATALVDPDDVPARRLLASSGWRSEPGGPPGMVRYRRLVLTHTFSR